jgi:acetolactate synthase-1/2/3 large subunit
MRLSDYVAAYFVEKKCDQVFMITGGGAMHLNDALGKSGMSCIFNHHEQACAIAAEAYYRVSNKIALVNVTSGPGGTNAITGVYGAWVDSASMIVLSGQVKRETMLGFYEDKNLRQLGDQEIDIISLVESITKYAVTVWDKSDIRYILDKAWHLATTGRPGPVWIDIPLDVQASDIDPASLKSYQPHVHDNHQVNDVLYSQINVLFSQLENHERPVFYLGTGVHISGQKNNIVEFCNKYSFPIVTAWNNNDLVDDENISYIGRPGTVGDRAGNFVVQHADILVVLGSRLNIRQISYNWENFAPKAYKVMVDIDSSELFKPTLKIDFPIHADLKDFIPALLRKGEHQLLKQKPKFSSWLAWCKKQKDRFKIPERFHLPEEDGTINPYRFMYELSKHFKEGNIQLLPMEVLV